jgi:hypothetical protein
MRSFLVAKAKITPTEIDVAAVYHVEEFRRRVGWGIAAFRQAKRNGLRVRHVHGRCYVHGRDFASYLDAQSTEDVDDA